jgi:carbonic anhydrase/acetyltransferase-like protein (isoleucine patch superfamily)
MAIYRLDTLVPEIADDAWIADSAIIIGDARIDSGASIWPQAVIRADNASITIGLNSNIQEAAVLHTDPGLPLTVADHVTVGHQAMLHGCTVGEGSLIGIQAIVLNGARIGRNCLVGAGSVVTEGKTFEDGMLIFGSPARVSRALREDEIARIALGNQTYVQRAVRFRTSLKRIG